MTKLISNSNPSIVWFRQDLRVQDQPALRAAIEKKCPIIPLFIWDHDMGPYSIGAASQWWLHYSLLSLEESLVELGLNLIIRKGAALEVLKQVIKETSAKSIYWNRRYEPALHKLDAEIQTNLQEDLLEVNIFNGALLYEPWKILNKNQQPFQVFTYFWKACLASNPCIQLKKTLDKPIPYTNSLPSTPIPALKLLPKIPWDKGLKSSWIPGERGGLQRLQYAEKHLISNYLTARDFPDLQGTSRLSPYLHFGEISPSRIWHDLKNSPLLKEEEVDAFLRQLGWREFGHYLLYHFPLTTDLPLNKKFTSMTWKDPSNNLLAWQKGLTGYPIIDAGMRELWTTGWMHNRVRMLVGSFLVKDLFLDWKLGAQWFWETLVDADLANNTLGWQWVAGCGADAAPYFRIFNPTLQSIKFDPEGSYIKKWVPELKNLPKKWIHKPWETPEMILQAANIKLGENYPFPIVDHEESRKEALELFKNL